MSILYLLLIFLWCEWSQNLRLSNLSFQTSATVVRSAAIGDQVLLSCNGLVQAGDSAFSWDLPSGHSILYSSALDPAQQTVQYISPNLQFSTEGDGSTQSQELDSKFSVEISSGSITIISFSTSSTSASDAVTTQAGTYTCRSVRGVYSYDVTDANVTTTTTATNTTTDAPVAGSSITGNDSLSEVSIYYIVLGVFLLLVLAGIVFMLAKISRRKKSTSSEESLTLSENPHFH